MSAWDACPQHPPLPLAQVHVWQAALGEGIVSQAELESVLSDDERARADHFRFANDRYRFVSARGLLRLLLSRYLQVSPSSIRLLYGQQGKPVLSAAPERVPLEFNLAHSGELVLFAFTCMGRVGVDVEAVRPIDELDAIAEQCFAPSEQATLACLQPAPRLATFFAYWTRREAYLKALGTGLSRSPHAHTVTPGATACACQRWVEGQTDELARWQLHSMWPAPGYVGALAIESSGAEFQCYRWAE